MASAETRQERERAAKKALARSAERSAGPPPEVVDLPLLEDWDGGIAKRTISFYHAEGAPYLDDQGKLHPQPPPEELDELQHRGLAIPPTILEEVVGEVVPIRDDLVRSKVYPAKAPRAPSTSAPEAPHQPRPPESTEEAREPDPVPSNRLSKPADFSGIEELAFLAFRSVFPGGVKIPIRKEGLANLDVIIKDKEIFIDIKGPLADAPSLSIWRFTFAFEGEPLMVYGRGVKGDIQVYRFRVMRFLWRAWRAKKLRKRKARLAARDDWGALARSNPVQRIRRRLEPK